MIPDKEPSGPSDAELAANGILRLPFIVVPPGEQPPATWLAEHPGAIRIPNGFVPRSGPHSSELPPFDLDAALGQILAQAAAPARPFHLRPRHHRQHGQLSYIQS